MVHKQPFKLPKSFLIPWLEPPIVIIHPLKKRGAFLKSTYKNPTNTFENKMWEIWNMKLLGILLNSINTPTNKNNNNNNNNKIKNLHFKWMEFCHHFWLLALQSDSFHIWFHFLIPYYAYLYNNLMA